MTPASKGYKDQLKRISVIILPKYVVKPNVTPKIRGKIVLMFKRLINIP